MLNNIKDKSRTKYEISKFCSFALSQCKKSVELINQTMACLIFTSFSSKLST